MHGWLSAWRYALTHKSEPRREKKEENPWAHISVTTSPLLMTLLVSPSACIYLSAHSLWVQLLLLACASVDVCNMRRCVRFRSASEPLFVFWRLRAFFPPSSSAELKSAVATHQYNICLETLSEGAPPSRPFYRMLPSIPSSLFSSS